MTGISVRPKIRFPLMPDVAAKSNFATGTRCLVVGSNPWHTTFVRATNKMILKGNSIFTLKVENKDYTILSGPYQEIYSEAQEIANYFKKPVSIWCHGTASIFATVTHL